MIRSLGGTAPLRAKTVAGTMHGVAAKAAVRFKNARRERFELFFCMRSLLNSVSLYKGKMPSLQILPQKRPCANAKYFAEKV
jgi:hypothetical protein